MSGASLNLVVIRAVDLERSRRFYEAIGLRFATERHGSGPEHLVAELGDVVFEIYPRGTGASSEGVRLGFRVELVKETMKALAAIGVEMVSPPIQGPWGLRAVVEDPDGHRVEIAAGT
jgi:catechol 2,3-dioxygenase-like lactoylglutathione lyase family enzyme